MKDSYIVIQGYILDKDLTPPEMMVCGLIDGFMKKYQYCNLDNATLGKILNRTPRYVSDIMSGLYAKNAITNLGTKKNRKLKLNYQEVAEKEIPKESQKDDESQRFEQLWGKEPSEKKDAKAEAKKYFTKLSNSRKEQLEHARAVYLRDTTDITYTTLLRTFISKEHYLDEKYQQKKSTKEEKVSETEFNMLIKKSLLLVGLSEKEGASTEKVFSEIKSKNEGLFFTKREVLCLEQAVCDMRGLIDQAYDEKNLRALLGTCW